MIRMTMPAPTATGSRRKRRQTVAQYPGDRGIGPNVAATVFIASAPLHAGVERGLQDVDHQIEDDEEERQHQDRALQQRQISLENRGVQQKARAGPREHGFDQDRTAEQVAELYPHDG